MAEETGTVEAVETTDVDTGDTILDTGDSILSESTSTDWREGLPEELANHTALESYKDIESLAKATIHAQKMVGGDKLVKPDPDSPKEEWDKFYSALGRPEKSSEYEMPTENMPSNVTFGDECYASFCEEAHRVGLSKDQAAAMMRWQATTNADAKDQFRQKMGQTATDHVSTLKTEFGEAFDDKVAYAKDAITRFGRDELKAALNETGLGNHPAMVRAFSKVGQMIAQDEVIGGGGNQSFRLSPNEALEQIAEKQLDSEFMTAYTSSFNVGHAAAQAEMTRLYEAAHPTVD